MMSPRPPPPIFPRDPSLGTVSEPPRTFNSNHLPPPIQSSGGYAPRNYNGPHLAPISISTGLGGGGSTMQHHPPAPHTPHIPPSQNSPASYAAQNQSDINLRRVSMGYDRILPDRAPAYSSTASTPSYSTPVCFSYDQRSEYSSSRRYSNEAPQENRRRRSSLTTIIPSPTYTVKRSPDESYQDEQTFPMCRFKPNSVEEVGNFRREMPVNRNSGRYRITVRQQPVAARACGFGERDRRVIDPPPIVQLIVNDSNGRSDSSELRYPFNVVHCTLWSVDGQTDETALTGQDKRLTRRLMGTLVSSPFVGSDEEGKEGCFFCFPDLSCRTHGKYRLRFVLTRLEPSESLQEYTPVITETTSEVFTVYTAKEFPGMRPSTALTKALKRQGCAISVKKGNEKTSGASGSGDEEEKALTTRSTIPKKRTSSTRNGEK
ncbi:velvet factor-domain-containing protein [Kalaharituber pfeilii]|nr:velvet factor-domain-containing protein [Kalaharituber pfeilii]